MRPIKFRQPLWDEHNEFAGWHYWGFVHGKSFTEPEGSPASSEDEARDQSQQFAGLCDRNGKDLDWWEGDLFKMHGHSTPWVIVKEKGCFWFKCPLTKEWVLCYRAAEYFHLPEKIGNIHENPELLEQAK